MPRSEIWRLLARLHWAMILLPPSRARGSARVTVIASAALAASFTMPSAVALGEPVVVEVAPQELMEIVRAEPAPVLINVWATWCVPCREEMPDLLRLRQTYSSAGLRVLLVSADFDRQLPAARRFLKDLGVNFLSYHKRGDDQQFIDALSPEWSGALPATFVFDADHHLVTWWEGRASFEELERAAGLVITTEGER